MNNPVVVVEKKPAKGTLSRIINKFETTNPIKQTYPGVIKNYIYVDQKRILA
jgi:hypothetical protein